MDFTLNFPSGAVAHCKTSYRGYVGNRLRIECETGIVQMSPAFSYGGLALGIQHGNDRPQLITPPGVGDQFAAEIDDFSRCILENKPPRTPGEEGLRDLKIMEAFYQSAANLAHLLSSDQRRWGCRPLAV